MKILVFSDLHVHAHKRSAERLQDCLTCLEWVFKTACDREIPYIIFGGDLFHERQKIDVLTYQRTFEIFERYMNNSMLRVDLLLGNHDLWHFEKWDISGVNPLRAIDNVRVIDKPMTLPYTDSASISYLPYTRNPIVDLAKIENSTEYLVENESDYKILVGHVAVDGALWNVAHGTRAEVSVEHDGDMVKVGPEIFDKWDQVFLGHYHAEQKLAENIEYIGSPLQLSFGEAFQKKHIIVYDLETHKKEYIRNEFSPKHLILKEKDLDKHKLEGNFLRIEVDDLSKSNVIDLRNELKKINVGTLEIGQSKKSVQDEDHIVEDAKAILYKDNEMLEKYISEIEKTTGLNDLAKERLIEIGKEIVNNDS